MSDIKDYHETMIKNLDGLISKCGSNDHEFKLALIFTKRFVKEFYASTTKAKSHLKNEN